MSLRRASSTLLACVASIVSRRAAAMTNGSVDERTPAVVALVEKTVFCSGTLIAPRVVLTAAHCLAHQPNVGFIRVTFRVGQGSEDVRAIAVSAIRMHPSFDETTFANDLALVVLASDAPVAPLSIDPRPLLPSDVGSTFDVVGVGGDQPFHEPQQVARFRGTVRLRALEDGRAVLDPAPAQPCRGDSGGPLLRRAGDVDRVVGVTSSGSDACEGGHRAALLEGQLASFVEPLVALTAGASVDDGARCLTDAACRSAHCYLPTDGSRYGYCSPPCGKDADCPGDMTCTNGSCRLATMPGDLGASCRTTADCTRGVCASRGGSPSSCARTCLSQLACSDGFACVPNALDTGTNVCLPAQRPPVASARPTRRLTVLFGVIALGATALVLVALRASRRRGSS